MVDYRIRDAAALQALIGDPMEQVRAKVGPQLNGAMKAFITSSPLVFLATLDESGHIDVSPKGDPAGFVEVNDDGNLLIPERPGNRLTFGFHNILRGGERGGEIGLIFVVPGQRESLRVKGLATLHHDPDVLARMAVREKPALLFTHVAVQECFFHCGKALIRSSLWQPANWQQETRSIAAQQMAGQTVPDAARVAQTEALLEDSYTNHLY